MRSTGVWVFSDFRGVVTNAEYMCRVCKDFLLTIDALKTWNPSLNVLSRWRALSSFEIALSGDDRDLAFVRNPPQVSPYRNHGVPR